MRRFGLPRVVLVALLLLGLGWAVAPHSAPPVYDGIGNPDDPYRFVVAPHGVTGNKTPTTATSSTAITHGVGGGIQAASFEQAPQVTVAIPAGRLHASGAKQITVTARAVRPLPAPGSTYLWSNVYDVTATGGATLQDGSPPATITLRAATAQQPRPTIEFHGASGWQPLKTVPVGNDIYQAPLTKLGEYAVFGAKPLDVSQINLGGGEDPATNTGIIIAAIAVALVLVLFVIGERRRSRARRARRVAAAEGSGTAAEAGTDAEETDE